MISNPAPRLERAKSASTGDTCARRRSAGGGQGGSGSDFLAGSARLYRRIAERVAPKLLLLRIAALAVAGPAIATGVTMLAASNPIAIMLVVGVVFGTYAAAMIDIADLIDARKMRDRTAALQSDAIESMARRMQSLTRRNLFLVKKSIDLRNQNDQLREIINSSAAGEGGGDAPRSDREVQRVPAADAENVFPFGPKGVA